MLAYSSEDGTASFSNVHTKWPENQIGGRIGSGANGARDVWL